MQMKRNLTLSLLILSSLCAMAQNEDKTITQSEEKTITLGEVVVKAAKVVNKMDGMELYPTEVQKKSSTNGYEILQKLSLPNIKIDAASHQVSAADNKGEVQVRINGIVVGRQEMLSLNPKSIARIDFINNPGVRYGDNIAYVIDITTRRADNGYTIGTDITATLTSRQGDGTAYGKWNKGKSELSLSYEFSGYKLKGMQNEERADYTLNDGNIYTISRNDIATQRKQLGHDIKLTYNWMDSTACVFQASLSGSFYRTPDNYNIKDISDGDNHYTATSRESGNNSSPVADLYFFRQLTPRQSITANAVGTYISTKSSNYYDEGTPYLYDVNGKSASILSEIIYENRLKPFTLSTGLNYRFKHIKNDYTGDAAALTEINNSTTYAFGEIKGMIRAWQYSFGAGASYIHYRQDTHSYNYWTFRPKVNLAYDLMQGMQLSYSFQMNDRVSRIAMINDATIRNNSMEWTVGNPNLKPNRDLEHTMQLAYNNARLQTNLNVYYKHCVKPNMALYERTNDNRFIYTQINQKAIDVLQSYGYASYWIVPEKLQVTAYGGLYRCFNFGNNYTHCYTSWFYASNIVAYLGNFSIVAVADNGNRFLEGENKGYNGGITALQASYKLHNWQFKLTWMSPFTPRYKQYESEILNRNLHKHAVGFDKDSGNRLTLNIAWRISQGKKRQSAEKTINLNDSDNGIMK